jgi:membrane protease YdiL (CAAX protease family)
MFRKVLIDRLSVYGDRLAVLISAVTFGLFHGNIDQLIYATAIGILFGSIYAKTRNIWHTIFLHMAVNFLGTVPGLIAANSMEEIIKLEELGSLVTEAEAAAGVFHMLLISIISILNIAISIAGLVLFIVFMVKKKIIPEKRCRIRLDGETLSKCVILNAGAILLLIYCTITIVLSLI